VPIDARIEELLARYPDQLSDAELTELREAGERDPAVESLMDRMHEVDGLLRQGGSAASTAPASLSPGGQRALSRVLEDLDDSVATDRNRVAGLSAWRRGRPLPAAWTALAAALLLGASALLVVELDHSGRLDEGLGSGGPGAALGLDSDLKLRGDLPEFTGNLEFEARPAVVQGMGRPVDQSVVFLVLVSLPAHLALLETQAGQTHVLHPSAGDSWRLDAGTHRLEPRPGASAYRPAAIGEASYALVGSSAPLQAPTGGTVLSVADFIADNEGAALLDERSIRWIAVE